MNHENYNDIRIMIINHIWKICVIATLSCTNMHPDICMLEYNIFYLNVLEE
jgi:hypothetical protein